MGMFLFLKYIQPTHYFHFNRREKGSIFPQAKELPEEVLQLLKKDDEYSSAAARAYDLSWQAIQKGYIGDANTYKSFEQLPLVDEYRFIRKNFHRVWVFYVLLIRLLSLKNPLKEIKDYVKTKSVKRIEYGKHPIKYPNYQQFHSALIQEKPMVSVVIPTLNRYEYLKDVLQDLEQQDYENFEVIIVDQSEPFQREFYDQYNLNIQLMHQKEKALWLARNNAIKAARGNIIMLSEDDVRIQSGWITAHLKCLDFFKADISAGPFYPQGSDLPQSSSYFKIASQFATGNAAFYKNMMQDIGMFDRQFEKQRMGDGEFGLRAYLAGYKSVSNPKASCIDVKAGEGGLRQLGSWDAFRSKNWLAPKPVPSVLYLFRKYYGNKAAKLALLKTVPSSIMPYQFKRNSYMMVLGALLSLLLLPIVLWQINRSWQLASKKLEEGDKIEYL